MVIIKKSFFYNQIFIYLLFVNFTYSQVSLDGRNQNAIKLIENKLIKENIPGLSVTISIDDSIVFSKGFGYANIERKDEIDPSKTKFRIASVTKTMTSSVIMKLSEEKMLNTKKSIYYYLDSLPKKKYNFTINEVGGHLAGLIRVPSEEKYDCENGYNRNDFYRVFQNDSLLFKPSTNFSYSNYGFKLLGVLIEKITRNSIIENHKKYIINKLNLINTIPDTGVYDEFTSSFYIFKNNAFSSAPCLDCNFKYSQGCYLSTSEDLNKLGNAYLFPNRILSKKNLLKMVKSQNFINGNKTNYGFGFTSITDSKGNYFYGHNGGYTGSSSILRVYPKKKMVISVLVNTTMINIDNLASEIASIYLN